MYRGDAVELAQNIRTLQYGEWTDVLDGLVYVSCGECGAAHAVLIKTTGPNMHRVRIDWDEQLVQATRENENLSLPLYREVLVKREESRQLTHRINDALQWIKNHGDAQHHHILEQILKGESHYDARI